MERSYRLRYKGPTFAIGQNRANVPTYLPQMDNGFCFPTALFRDPQTTSSYCIASTFRFAKNCLRGYNQAQ